MREIDKLKIQSFEFYQELDRLASEIAAHQQRAAELQEKIRVNRQKIQQLSAIPEGVPAEMSAT